MSERMGTGEQVRSGDLHTLIAAALHILHLSGLIDEGPMGCKECHHINVALLCCNVQGCDSVLWAQ